MSDPRKLTGPTPAEAVGTLVWLLDASDVDQRRSAIVSRLRTLRDSDEFETLPEALRDRVREILDEGR